MTSGKCPLRILIPELPATRLISEKCRESELESGRKKYLTFLWLFSSVSTSPLKACKDRYREVCQKRGMHLDLVRRYIELQTILLSPICSHVCEHIWRKLLGKKESVFSANWPKQADAIDNQVQLEGESRNSSSNDIYMLTCVKSSVTQEERHRPHVIVAS